MCVLALLGLMLVAPGETPSAVSAQTRKTYEAKRVEAGRNAPAHVNLAEWCGKHGMSAERAKHLNMAILLEPENARARELLGLPAYEDRAQKAAAAREAATEEALAEYNALREQAPRTANANATLARWCERHGLDAEAKMHWSEVTRLDPKNELAWSRLGFAKYNGRWMTAGQVQELEAQNQANHTWGRRLHALHLQLHSEPTHLAAEEAIAQVRDPRAVPAVFHELSGGRPTDQLLAVSIFQNIRTRASSQALAALAVFGATPEIRGRATKALRDRDPLDYLGGMLALITDPIRYEIRPVGEDGTPGALFVEGEKFNVKRVYAPPQIQTMPLKPGEFVTYDASGLPIVTRPDPSADAAGMPSNPWPGDVIGPITDRIGKCGLPNDHALATVSPPHAQQRTPGGSMFPRPMTPAEMQNLQVAATFEARLEGDVRLLESINQGRLALASYVLALARDATGQDLGADPKPWRDWLTKQSGRSSPSAEPKQTLVMLNPAPALLPRPPVFR